MRHLIEETWNFVWFYSQFCSLATGVDSVQHIQPLSMVVKDRLSDTPNGVDVIKRYDSLCNTVLKSSLKFVYKLFYSRSKLYGSVYI
jgi:hypothetical protein